MSVFKHSVAYRPRDQPFHYIYKISCEETGQVYYGRHSSEQEHDPHYTGSGLWVRWARAKGLTLKKEVLWQAENFEELCEMELLVIQTVIEDENCVNVYTEHWDVSSRFKGWYITPHGKFLSKRDAAKVIDGVAASTIYQRCVYCDIPIQTSRWLPREYDGKTWRELGWYFISKEDM